MRFIFIKKGYSNIVSLGSEAGTQKTTKGTPDTYFAVSNQKYIFVEYSTQRAGLFQKMKEDIAKCLDESSTQISLCEIAEIIYCHTSSNITPAQDTELRKMCEDKGVLFSAIGIDKLAEDIYLSYPKLAHDFLGIEVSTGQILSTADFIKEYNSNLMAAPIDTEFSFRDKEIESIGKAFENNNVVILSGAAGTGKTRLALHYADRFFSGTDMTVYCFHSNALTLYVDLKTTIDTPGSFFFIVDDANQLSELCHVVRYVNKKVDGYNVKSLITVRDYALEKVRSDIRMISTYDIVKVNALTDDEIKKILESSLGIKNQNCMERIVRIAEGNVRIAVLAGKLAVKSNKLSSINDTSELFDNYYGTFLDDNCDIVERIQKAGRA